MGLLSNLDGSYSNLGSSETGSDSQPWWPIVFLVVYRSLLLAPVVSYSCIGGLQKSTGGSETVSDEFKNTVLVVGIVWNKEHSAGGME